MLLPQSSLDSLSALLSNPEALRAELARRETERADTKKQAEIDAEIARLLSEGKMFSRRAYTDGPRADFPLWCEGLFKPKRYKCVHGGRAGAKSHSMVAAILILGLERPLRIVVARLTKSAIKESAHELIEQKIRQLGMLEQYRVQQNKIYGPNGTEFSFYGLQDRSVDAIRSFEGADIVFVEEAAGISAHAWRTLGPTVRKPGSEIWLAFNPILNTDATYRRFVLTKSEEIWAVKVNWDSNPWFPDVLRPEKDELMLSDPAEYRHIWEGEPRDTTEGAIFVNEIKAALNDDPPRIGVVPYDRTKPVDVVYDLGFGDPTVQLYVQGYGGFLNVIDFYTDSKADINHFVMVSQQRGYIIRNHWLPWDAARRDIHKKLGGVADKAISINRIMEGLGCSVKQAAGISKEDTLDLTRAKWPLVRIDQTKCADLLQALRHYQWDRKATSPTDSEGTKPGQRKALHNWASHASDAFQIMCTSISPLGEPPKPEKPETPKPVMMHRGAMA